MTATTLADRAVLRIAGAEARPFLQGLVTQDVGAVLPGRPQWSGLLTPQGKALFDFLLWDDGEAILIDCQRAEREALARRLMVYRLRRAIDIAPVDTAVHWQSDGDRGVADPRLASLGRRWLGPAEGAAEGWAPHRLALGVTEGVGELGSGETLWLECNARELNGVDFAKGCYVGQENTARMHHRSKVNRRLVVTANDDASDDRVRVRYPELALAVALRRVEALGDALIPGWLANALDADQRPTAL